MAKIIRNEFPVEFENRILNMDCLDFMKQLPDNCVEMILTDIPYGECNKERSGKNSKNRMFRNIDKGKSDDISTLNLEATLEQFVRICAGSVYVFCPTEQVSFIRDYLDDFMTTRLCIWEKTNPCPMHGQRFWLSSIECCVFGRKSKAVFNEFCKSSVWRFPSGSSKRHPTEKNLKLFEYLVNTSSNENQIILDPFAGSGTTAEACLKNNRKYCCVELDAEYHSVAEKRIETYYENLKIRK